MFSTQLFEILRHQYDKLGFTKLEDELFELLCIARIVELTLKLDSLSVLADLGISQACFDHVQKHGLSLLLYDVTTLFFQVDEADEYRKPGLSKERRLEPQIIIGLLVDKNGFPLG